MQLYTKLLNRYHQTMINGYDKYNWDSDTYYIKRWRQKNIVINIIGSGDDKENKIRKMRKIKNKKSIDQISHELLIKQKDKKHCSEKKSQLFFQKQNKKEKKKVEIKTEIKPPKKEKIKAQKRKRENEINIDEIRKKTEKQRKQSKKLLVDQIVERERIKNKKKY